jgi:hypothetical protein
MKRKDIEMKRFATLLILFLIIFETNCAANSNNITNDINQKAQKARYYHYLSLAFIGNGIMGGIAFKKDKNLETTLTVFPKTSFATFEINDNNWTHITFCNWDSKACTMTRMDYYIEKSTPIKKIYELKEKNIHKWYNHYAWENSIRGIAIRSKYVKLASKGVVNITGQKWNLHFSEYDLTNTEHQLPSPNPKGFLYIWYAADKQSAVELYTDTAKKPVVIRKLYLDNKEFFKDEPRDNPESLVKMFMTLYQEAGLYRFVETVK